MAFCVSTIKAKTSIRLSCLPPITGGGRCRYRHVLLPYFSPIIPITSSFLFRRFFFEQSAATKAESSYASTRNRWNNFDNIGTRKVQNLTTNTATGCNSCHSRSLVCDRKYHQYNNDNSRRNRKCDHLRYEIRRLFTTTDSTTGSISETAKATATANKVENNDSSEEGGLHYTTTATTKEELETSPQLITTKATMAMTSDPPILTWVDNFLPPGLRPYGRLARVDKPIGTWLLLWPCFWSTALASGGDCSGIETGNNIGSAISASSSSCFDQFSSSLPDPFLMALFTAGAFVMRGAGCTINDMWDVDFDKRVSRTVDRPLAKGDLTQTQALGFLAAQLSVGLGVLLSLPNITYCFVWGASSLPLVIAYPLMKRYTNWPQLFLGLTFNWGAWMGWAATYGSMDYSIIGPLYGSGVTWTLVYDTIYANQDKHDDKILGLKSTALTFGSDVNRHKQILHAFALATYAQWMLVGYNCFDSGIGFGNDCNIGGLVPYLAGSTIAYGHLVWQIQTADLNDPHNLSQRFRSNTTVGGIIFASIVTGNMLEGATAVFV